MNDEEKLELSLEGILQAIANVNLEDDINFDISELFKDSLEDILKKIQKQSICIVSAYLSIYL